MRASLSYGWQSVGWNGSEYDLAEIPDLFGENAKFISDFVKSLEKRDTRFYQVALAYDDAIRLKEAFEYFGFYFEVDSFSSESYDAEYAKGHVTINYHGLRARPDWSAVDRSKNPITSVTEALRSAIKCVNSDNHNEANAIMSGVEKSQLLVTLKCALTELEEAPYVNKSALRGLSIWCGQLASKASEKYLSTELSNILGSAAIKILDFVKSIPHGSHHLPWF